MQIYLAFHRIEFTDFTTAELYLLSVALVRFPKKGRALPAILLYGVRTPLSRSMANSDKIACLTAKVLIVDNFKEVFDPSIKGCFVHCVYLF